MQKSPFSFFVTWAVSLLATAAPALGSHTFTGGATRGAVNYNGSSLGAFTSTADSLSFQGRVTTSNPDIYNDRSSGDHVIYQLVPEPFPVTTYRFAESLLDPALPEGTYSGTFLTGTPLSEPPLVEISLYAPSHLVPGALQHYYFDGRHSLEYTITVRTPGTAFRYTLKLTNITGPDSEVYSFTNSGLITFATEPGMAAILDDSWSLVGPDRALTILAKGRAPGPLAPIPEPATVAWWVGGAMLAVACWSRRAQARV